MTLRRTTKAFTESFGRVRVTLDDLIEIESMLPPEPTEKYEIAGRRSITAGSYEVDRINDLRESSEATLPGITIQSISCVTVHIYGVWAKVESTSNSAQNNEIARHIADLLRRRRVPGWAGFNTPTRLGLGIGLQIVLVPLIVLAAILVTRLDRDEPAVTALLVAVVLAGVLCFVGYTRLFLRTSPPHAVILRAAGERWIDRYGTWVEIAIAAIMGTAALAATIYFGVRAD